jgi:hypothetical protein
MQVRWDYLIETDVDRAVTKSKARLFLQVRRVLRFLRQAAFVGFSLAGVRRYRACQRNQPASCAISIS